MWCNLPEQCMIQGWTFPLMRFEFVKLADLLNVVYECPGQWGWDGAEVMSYLSYCCGSSPPLHRRNPLRRALTLMYH